MEGNDCPHDTKKKEEVSECEELSFFVQELLFLESTRNNKNEPYAKIDNLVEMMSWFFFKFLQTVVNQRCINTIKYQGRINDKNSSAIMSSNKNVLHPFIIELNE